MSTSYCSDKTWRTRKTVNAPLSMKVSVATSDRGDNRARPQTPWPLVQPLPWDVPQPTSKPPSTSDHDDSDERCETACPVNRKYAELAPIIPSKKAALQARLPSASCQPSSKPWAMLLMPASLPRLANSATAEVPISNPPSKPDQGVNWLMRIRTSSRRTGPECLPSNARWPRRCQS